MPAKSKAQQRFMGMVHSYNKGDMKDAPTSVKKAAKGMTKKSAKDFASTKHKGKPEHVDESLRRLIRQEIRAYNEAKTINVEPNWEGLYKFMMHMKKGDNAAFVRVTRKMGSDWKKIVAMAEKNKWKTESVEEASVPRNQLNRLGSELNKASETIIKITDKYKKEGDIGGMVKIWMRGLHLRLKKNGIKIESVNEKVSSPFSQHLKDAQEEVEYMISEHPGAAEEGVYDKPKQAIKFLQVAQKALGKIT
jgi:hypothetical protein